MKITTCLLVPLLFLTGALAQAEEKVLKVTVSPIKGNLHLLQGQGGNIVASVGDDGILIVDSDYQEYAPAYLQAMENLGGDHPAFLINTHWHFDHVGGNAQWGEKGSIIVAHRNVRNRMSTRQEMKAFDRVVEPSPKPAWPIVTFADSMALHFNGDDIEVQHFPAGHTDGDSVVFFTGENVVHMGDHFFKDRFPFVDMGSGGSVPGYLANQEAVLQKLDADTVVVPGHGSLADRDDLARSAAMIRGTRAEVKAMLDKGMTEQQILDQGLDAQWAEWGSGFINEEYWIRFLLASFQ